MQSSSCFHASFKKILPNEPLVTYIKVSTAKAYVSSNGSKSIFVPFDSSHEHTLSFLQVSSDEEDAIFKITKIKSVHSTPGRAIYFVTSLDKCK